MAHPVRTDARVTDQKCIDLDSVQTHITPPPLKKPTQLNLPLIASKHVCFQMVCLSGCGN